jgi:hypothetical protein
VPPPVDLLPHGLFGFLVFLGGLFKLPSWHPLDCDCFDFFPNSFVFKKATESPANFPSHFPYFWPLYYVEDQSCRFL